MCSSSFENFKGEDKVDLEIYIRESCRDTKKIEEQENLRR
jgi:hypothetical protein